MTVGEKIQSYRKNLGLSQEELGQKLCVSRQTVSLWENGQTVPTIDNLVLLKEIFGVSVDELLDVNDGGSFSEPIPTESYSFSFLQDEIETVYKLQKPALYKRPIIFALLSVWLIYSFISLSAPDFLIGLFFGIFFFGEVYQLKGIRAFKRIWKTSKEKIPDCTYEYKIYQDFFIIDIYRQGEKTRESKCRFADIEKIQNIGNYLLLQFGGQIFIIKKVDLKKESFFYYYMYNNPDKTIEKKTHDKWQVSSIILFVASLLSASFATELVETLSNINNLFMENMWLFFLFTPIPVASTVFGFVLKSKGYKYKKNIVVGIIMTVLLCIFGSYAFIFKDF